jgi:hypothetical protein
LSARTSNHNLTFDTAAVGKIKGNVTITAAVVAGIPQWHVWRKGEKESPIRSSTLVPPSWLADMPSAGFLPISLDGLPPPPSSGVTAGLVDGGGEARWAGGGR